MIQYIGMEDGGEVVAFEGAESYTMEDASLILNEEMDSDPIANMMVQASVMGITLEDDIRGERCAMLGALYIIEEFEVNGYDDVAAYWFGNLFGKVA